MKITTMSCCGKTFDTRKAFTNHDRWCSGRVIYKGNGYMAVHAWVRKRKIKPSLCEKCRAVPPLDLANISGKCLRDLNDYLYLCRSCHKKMDFTEKTRTLLSIRVKNRKRNERGEFL